MNLMKMGKTLQPFEDDETLVFNKDEKVWVEALLESNEVRVTAQIDASRRVRFPANVFTQLRAKGYFVAL